MLASILPGVRAFRASLVAGMFILATIYIIFAERISYALEDNRLSPGLISLKEYLMEGGWLVLMSVAAYILGSILTAAREILIKNLAARLVAQISSDRYLSHGRREQRIVSLLAPFSRVSIRRLGMLGGGEYQRELARKVCIDIIFADGKRLLAAHKDLHDEYDRIRAEAEFRDSVGLPSVVLGITILAHMDVSDGRIWAGVLLGLLLLLAALFLQARQLDRIALSLHAHAVADGLVSTASLDDPEKQSRHRWV